MGSVALNLGTLVIRADSSIRIGTGHIMRCFALAQSWVLKGGKVVFLSNCENDALRQRISMIDMDFIPITQPHPNPQDLEFTLDFMRKQSDVTNNKTAWLVLDGYHFDSSYQKQVKEAGYKLFVIDDKAHLEHYYADILLNQNIHANWLQYSCENYTKLLLGTQYVMLRREFLPWHRWQRKLPSLTKKVLVTLGGSDPDNQTARVIQALKLVKIKGLEAKVVVGSGNPYFKKLLIEENTSPYFIDILHDVINMPKLMAWADIAVTSGGSTCWEMAFMGLPAVVGQISEVEGLLVNGIKQHGLFLRAGWFSQLSTKDIADLMVELAMDDAIQAKMSILGRQTVDGYGCDRILEAIQTQERIIL